MNTLLIRLEWWAKCLRHVSVIDSCRLVLYASATGRGAAERLAKIELRGIGGVYVRPDTSDPFVLRQVFIERQYDLSEAPQFQWIVKKYEEYLENGVMPLIIDCGANIGFSSLFFSSMFPKAVIAAVEPASDNIAVAKRNIATNPNIYLVEAAIHSRVGEVALVDPGLGKWGYVTSAASASSLVVRSITIEQIMQQRAHERALIVKIDIEGAESDLFADDFGWLEKIDLLIIELHDWLFPGRQTSANFFAAISKRRFDVVQKGENLLFFFM